jgi:uncharacterized surface protein with fasciclin (FAS1) repeats
VARELLSPAKKAVSGGQSQNNQRKGIDPQLARALCTEELIDTLRAQSDITVFAPTDSVFGKF